ncbi:Smr/MutS family protein [Lacinutrix jangbogonensis]|uniref:Smr/MutS family protein n=1 Tax=Lacinutrix jangbogonensis TaxID=1469557 RepID=UPI00053CF539|nr:Smr/MutS family protein [Lacinutrix jangbogonensis]
MSFNIGDFVYVLDEALSGNIIRIVGSEITIEDEDGFELSFRAHEIVKKQGDSLRKGAFRSKSINQVLSEKESNKKRTLPRVKPKERFQPTMEVDLHIHHLVKSERHLGSHDKKLIQLETAKHKLEFAMQKKIQKIVFIHGVGEGTLKLELEYLFKRYNNLKFYDADYKKYGQGATEVYIYQNIDPHD